MDITCRYHSNTIGRFEINEEIDSQFQSIVLRSSPPVTPIIIPRILDNGSEASHILQSAAQSSNALEERKMSVSNDPPNLVRSRCESGSLKKLRKEHVRRRQQPGFLLHLGPPTPVPLKKVAFE